MPLHALLKRQLRRIGIDPGAADLGASWGELLQHVSRGLHGFPVGLAPHNDADQGRDLRFFSHAAQFTIRTKSRQGDFEID